MALGELIGRGLFYGLHMTAGLAIAGYRCAALRKVVMNDVSHRESFAFSARVLGALFYFAPDSEQTAPLVSALTAGDWVQDWPLAEENLLPVASMFKTPSDEALKDARQRLFIGPYALPAPVGLGLA